MLRPYRLIVQAPDYSGSPATKLRSLTARWLGVTEDGDDNTEPYYSRRSGAYNYPK